MVTDFFGVLSMIRRSGTWVPPADKPRIHFNRRNYTSIGSKSHCCGCNEKLLGVLFRGMDKGFQLFSCSLYVSGRSINSWPNHRLVLNIPFRASRRLEPYYNFLLTDERSTPRDAHLSSLAVDYFRTTRLRRWTNVARHWVLYRYRNQVLVLSTCTYGRHALGQIQVGECAANIVSVFHTSKFVRRVHFCQTTSKLLAPIPCSNEDLFVLAIHATNDI
jgi:hypothetical protein